MAFRITSPAFADGAEIPSRYTCDGENRSPRLTWSDAPAGTLAFALIMDDPDAPRGTFTHWVQYDIPMATTELAESVPGGTVGVAGHNSFQRTGYGGPCPPPGDAAHRYRFTLHALDAPSLSLAANAERDEVEARMSGHVIGVTQLVGTYARRARAGASPAGR